MRLLSSVKRKLHRAKCVDVEVNRLHCSAFTASLDQHWYSVLDKFSLPECSQMLLREHLKLDRDVAGAKTR